MRKFDLRAVAMVYLYATQNWPSHDIRVLYRTATYPAIIVIFSSKVQTAAILLMAP